MNSVRGFLENGKKYVVNVEISRSKVTVFSIKLTYKWLN